MKIWVLESAIGCEAVFTTKEDAMKSGEMTFRTVGDWIRTVLGNREWWEIDVEIGTKLSICELELLTEAQNFLM
jgi:hypothetical protein